MLQFSFAEKFKITDPISHLTQTSRGIEDMIIQLEYAYYDKKTTTSVTQFTIVTNIALPTGSAYKKPPTGFGASSFFIGGTASCLKTDWYYFTALGAKLTTSNNDTKFGNAFLYQFGLGNNICYKIDKWIFNWLVELDGVYNQRDKLLGCINQNTGGNIIFLGPSLFFSTKHLVLQGGISWVAWGNISMVYKTKIISMQL